ncbi:MAG: S8 family serine peptidase [Oscillospiraceae bacterium]|nr:S8 family serine peptidase [Oscillospiraceae bacterium]
MKFAKRVLCMLTLAVLLCVMLATNVLAAELEGSVWMNLDLNSAEENTVVRIVTDTTVTDGLLKLTYDSEKLTFESVTVYEDYVAMYSVNAEEKGTVLISWVAPEAYETNGETVVLMRVTFSGKGRPADVEMTGVMQDPDGNTVKIGTVDTTALAEAVAQAEALDPNDYTPKSYTVVEKALTAAKAVLADPTATQAEVDAAAKALNDAMAALLPYGTILTDELEALIQEAEGKDEAMYTPATYAAMEEALADAKAVLADPDHTQEEIDDAAAALAAAIDGLVKKSTNPDTGDSFPAAVFGLLALGSLAGLMVLTAMNKKWASRALMLVLALTLALPMVGGVARAEENTTDPENLTFETLENPGLTGSLVHGIGKDNVLEQPQVDPDAMVKVIILMDAKSIIQEDPDAQLTAEVQQKIEALEQEQDKVVKKIEKEVLEGEPLEISYSYTWLLNAVAATVPYGTIAEIEALQGVSRVFLQLTYEVCETENSVSNPNTVTDGVMIGREPTWANGYTGEGMKIAIIDTGLDIDHQNFTALTEDKLTDTSADQDTIAAVLGDLNASKRYPGLTVEDVHYNTKVVYGFNYCDDDLDITHADGRGDHGTHVAGIAAANKAEGSEVVGVAPDAQLYVMKVFGKNGGAYTMDILAALEDALMLGADVINMSLGSPAGFTSGDMTEMGDLLDPVYAGIAQTGTVLSVSAGNNYNSGFYNNWGLDKNLTENPDNGVVGSPGSYVNTMTVASYENSMVQRSFIAAGDYRIVYVDSTDYGLPAVTTLTGAYEVVVVPGVGAESDYEGLDVTGKIALVQRGELSFLDKHTIAEAKGAVACLIYNNTDGEFGADMTGTANTTPCAMITMADGRYLVAAVKADPTLKITFPTEYAPFPSPYANEMSEFSSWGPAPDLSLAPDITAPGGNIYSTVDNGGYDVMSGTSMAAPNIAGMAALVMQYVKETFPTGTDYRAVTQNLLMSTAIPVVYGPNGLTYSPRSQGSGLANVFNAVTTQAYLTVDGVEMPKVELGDDADRTGAYSYTFNVHNFGDAPVYYTLDTNIQTEGYDDVQGYYFMSGTPVSLNGWTAESSAAFVYIHDLDADGDADSHDAYTAYQAVKAGTALESMRADLNGDETVTKADVQAYLDALVGNNDVDLSAEALRVAPGETAAVTVNVTLANAAKEYLDEVYTNGGYVEGFTTLTALHDGGVDLSLPYMGFYGDWAEAPMLDFASYWDYINYGDSIIPGNQYIHALFTELMGDEYGMYPGMNPYVGEMFDMNHVSLSPNGDGYADTVTDIYISLLRNAETLTITYTDMDTGEEYFGVQINNVSKSVFYSNYGQVIPFAYDLFIAEPGLYDWEGLENNTRVLLQVEAVGLDENEEPEYWQVPITVDLEAPELLNAIRTEDPETGRTYLTLEFRDNVSASAVILADPSGTQLYGITGVQDVEPDENGYQNYTLTFDITGITGKMMIILSDYAVNESYYGINMGGEGAPYGDLVAYQYNYNTGFYGWVSFNSGVDYNETAIFPNYGVDFVAAEYVGGYVFAQTEDGKLYGFRYEDMLNNTMDLESTYIATLENVYQDFAYNYSDGKLYGLVTTEEMWYGVPSVQSEIFVININGEYFDETLWSEMAPYQEEWYAGRGELAGLGLAIDDEGSFYIMGSHYEDHYDEETWEYLGTTESTAQIWKASMEESWDGMRLGAFRLVGDTGMELDFLQSMAWDHNTETLYWARFDAGATYMVSELIQVDPSVVTEDENGNPMVSAVKVGNLSGETCALFAPLTAESAAKAEHANLPEMDPSVIGTPILREETLTMSIGGTKQLSYDIDPWYTDHKTVVWTSSDPNVVTVDGSGFITAVNPGSAVITIASAEDETKFDTLSVEVTALDLKIEGVLSTQGSGIGSFYNARPYTFNMVEGVATLTEGSPITAPNEMNYGLALGTTEFGRGSIWTCEVGNTGMVYEIDPYTGAVKDVLAPIDGDMLFGMHYSESMDSFTGIMNYFMYVDMPMNHEQEEEMLNSYDEETNMFMWHRLNMLPYLMESNTGFITGETGQGASSEIVFCGITGIDGGIKDMYGQTYYYDTYKDYLGNWAAGMPCSYQPDQTLILLDNVGRLWYINEVTGVTMESDEWGNVFLTTPDGGSIDGTRNGVILSEDVAEDGTYSVFHITKIVETPLTDMFREGTMPRITYHFSDIEFAGYTKDNDPMILMSLYDYWNNGSTNELFLYVPGHETEEMDYETWEPIRTPDRLFALGSTGEYNIIASIHYAEVTGGVDPEEPAEAGVNPLGIGSYRSGSR